MNNIDALSQTEALAKEKSKIISRYSQKSDLTASIQLVTTILPFIAIWCLAIVSWSYSLWLTSLCIFALCLFLLRVFVLMHECGHNALFKTAEYNKIAGFMLGVICGMPQYVWSKNHAFHHATNGNWDQYRGPLATLKVDEFNALSSKQKLLYRMTRNILFAPIGGFLYLIFNPRFNWIKGCVGLLVHLVKTKRKSPDLSIKRHSEKF